jgi:hypothetical protein
VHSLKLVYAILPDYLSTTGYNISVLAFEGATHNETIQKLLWEVVRHAEAAAVAGSPHFVALGVKASVSSSCFQSSFNASRQINLTIPIC